MDKKGIKELKKMFAADGYAISDIGMCYVDENKEKTVVPVRLFNLPEDEMHKYLAIFKKVLSGSFDKNLWNVDFPLSSEDEGGCQNLLFNCMKEYKGEEPLTNELYDRIIGTYLPASQERYCIITAFGAYDIPGKSSDNMDIEFVYDYVAYKGK